jgi:hypothetical protein
MFSGRMRNGLETPILIIHYFPVSAQDATYGEKLKGMFTPLPIEHLCVLLEAQAVF